MRKLLWAVALLALATSLDSALYGGFYTRSVSRLLTDVSMHAH